MENQPIQNSKHEPCVCNLTPADFVRRKSTVIAEVKKNVRESKETDHGFVYRFEGSDPVLDQLVDFIKTERECCDFFTFRLSVKGATESIWLELTGPPESKEFIKVELGL